MTTPKRRPYVPTRTKGNPLFKGTVKDIKDKVREVLTQGERNSVFTTVQAWAERNASKGVKYCGEGFFILDVTYWRNLVGVPDGLFWCADPFHVLPPFRHWIQNAMEHEKLYQVCHFPKREEYGEMTPRMEQAFDGKRLECNCPLCNVRGTYAKKLWD